MGEKLNAIIILASLVVACSTPADTEISTPTDLIGHAFSSDSLPPGIVDQPYGWVIKDGWTVGRVLYREKTWLVFEGLAGQPNEYGYRTKRVLDVLQLPPDESPLDLAVGCRLVSGPVDWSVFGIADYTSEDWLTMRWAWRANTETGRFERLPVDGLECVNEGSGV